MVLERFNKMLQRPTTESKGSHWSPLHRRQNFRVDSLSASQQALLVREGPPAGDFVVHDEFPKDALLPVVDLALFDDADPVTRKQSVEHLVKACQDWGYFFLVHHGVDLALMQTVREQAHECFARSAAKHSSQHSLLQNLKRWSEGVQITPAETSMDECDNQLSPPETDHQLSAAVKAYDAAMKALAMRLVTLLADGLGVKAWRFSQHLEGGEATLRWSFQPPCPRPESAMGLGPRSDPCLLTLQQGSGGGLQLLREGKWRAVPTREEAILVNVGDVFEILTNGRFQSPSHRTVVSPAEGRLSVAHSLAPAKSATLIPPPEILKVGANLYKTRTYAEYLAARKRLDSRNSLEFMKLPTSV